jgi:competence ComEA-like helix-hairpin-helix protein
MQYEIEQSRTSRSAARLLAVAAALLATAVLTTATVATSQSTPTTTAPVDDEELTRAGEDAIKKICTECHSFDDIVISRRTPKEWKDVVTQMATKGAIATQAQFGTIREYLTRFYGIVPINTAPAPDLAAVLGLSAKQAEAIVEYRSSHGKFADLPALLKVPGLDKDRLEADPDALKFD